MYVVTGVTGRTGRVVADRLLERGEAVRVVLRDASKAKAWRERGAEVAMADLADTSAMTAAFVGATGAYLVKPPGYDREDLFEHAQATTDAVAEAARRAGVPKLVLLSSIGADRESGVGVIATNRMAEQRLSTLGIPVAFLRAAYFMENWARVIEPAKVDGVLPSLLSPTDRAIPMVATEDIGASAADIIGQSWEGIRIVDLDGPRAYSPDDVAAAFAKVLGRAVSAVAIDEAQWAGVLARQPFSRTAIEGFITMNRALNSGHIAFADATTEHVHGRRTIDDIIGGLLVTQ